MLTLEERMDIPDGREVIYTSRALPKSTAGMDRKPCGDLSTFARALNAMVDYTQHKLSGNNLFYTLINEVSTPEAQELLDLFIKTKMEKA